VAQIYHLTAAALTEHMEACESVGEAKL